MQANFGSTFPVREQGIKAMNEMKPISNFKNKLYQVAVILLLAYAALATAMKDLNRFQEVAGNVQTVTADGLGTLVRAYSVTRSSWANEAGAVQEPQLNSIGESTSGDMLAAGGSVELAGFERGDAEQGDNNALVASLHNKDTCSLKKAELRKNNNKDQKWEVLAAAPQRTAVKRIALLRHDIPVEISVDRNSEIASALRRAPRLRTIFNKLPVKPGKEKWSNVSELKSLNDLISFGMKAARVDESEMERKVERVQSSDDNSHFVFEFKRGATDSERDEEMRQ